MLLIKLTPTPNNKICCGLTPITLFGVGVNYASTAMLIIKGVFKVVNSPKKNRGQ